MILQVLLFSTYLSSVLGGCPFSGEDSNSTDEIPRDPAHQTVLQRKEVAEQRERHDNIIAIAEQRDQRKLQTGCVTENIYNNLMNDVRALGNAFNNNGSRGHFFGGIVRLAAHDFMDFDRRNTPLGGMDGCIDFQHEKNAGLDIVWCNNGCPLTQLYDRAYSFMSRADFWVAAANGSIKATATNGYEPPFRWGRPDRDVCAESSDRLPLDTGCDQVESLFLTRMGLSWTDATALLGAHTLGRGTRRNSNHDGTWVQNGQASGVFDKGYYDELIRRAWFPVSQNGKQHDWTWGGNNRNVMMLNIDICLQFDISNPDCCTNRNGGNCRAGGNRQCPNSNNRETTNAIADFRSGRNNSNFYAAFSTAWQLAVENGRTGLRNLGTGCAPTPAPTPRGPTESPTISPTTVACADKDCQYIADNNLCAGFEELCPVACRAGTCGTIDDNIFDGENSDEEN